jgi:hydroxymethylpyrimidine pyrophosphatase-like HAD family hydrolase
MLPIERLPEDEARGLRVLLFDLDDTVLTDGRLCEESYRALFRLKDSGLELVAVTGRPLDWGAVLARQWPVAGVVTENGAAAAARGVHGLEIIDFGHAERSARKARLAEIVRTVKARFPELHASDDVQGRLTDFTFDIGEHERVPADTVLAVQSFARSLGARTVASSVHVHLTLDGLDKATGAARFLSTRLGMDPTECRIRAAFVGDSENDAACFSAFRTTLGVANLRGRPTLPPRFITTKEKGAGFAEAAAVIATKRGSGPR